VPSRNTQPEPGAIIDRAGLGGHVAFSVADARTGALLESGGEATGLPPASVAKALTAAYALDTLGPGHHFATRLIATGAMRDGTIEGDLVLAGGGDPTLDTDALADLAKTLKAAGIRAVRGRFLLWAGGLPSLVEIDPEQPDHVGYNPSVSGLNLNYNRVHFEWRRGGDGYAVTMQARSERFRPGVTVARMRVAARDTPVYTYSDAGNHDDWTVASGALGSGGARWLPVRKPELYAGEVFEAFARSHGIVLPAPEPAETLPEGRVMATHHSPPLRIILRDMLRWSTNLTAEVVGLAATAARSGVPPASIRASAETMNAWGRERLGLESMALEDHSGLGDDSRISAADMMRALAQSRRRTGLKTLLKPFPMRDAQRRVIRDHPLGVHAKTGTLNFVSGLAGFIDMPDGRELVFAIFAANMDRRDALAVHQRERPPGGADWNRRAKGLQQALIERWGVVYAA
jgi:D-alanyl-D-alanine carboxypeptidase/D-alanyl-D-alanine-endopeptidase (penicillin-binding protein 4)